MKPIIHAQNSAKLFGKAEAYFDLHQLMDISKSTLPDVRHRMMFHHKEGIGFVVSILGKKISASPTTLTLVSKITEQHINEDLSFIPPLQKYLDLIPLEKWMKEAYHAFPTKSCEFAKTYPKIHSFLYQFLTPDPRSIILVCNTLMPYFVEKKFGPLVGKKPTRDIVEKFISSFVEIQGLEFLLDDMAVESWMVRPALLKKDVIQIPKKKQTVIHKTIRQIIQDPMSRRLD